MSSKKRKGDASLVRRTTEERHQLLLELGWERFRFFRDIRHHYRHKLQQWYLIVWPNKRRVLVKEINRTQFRVMLFEDALNWLNGIPLPTRPYYLY